MADALSAPAVPPPRQQQPAAEARRGAPPRPATACWGSRSELSWCCSRWEVGGAARPCGCCCGGRPERLRGGPRRRQSKEEEEEEDCRSRGRAFFPHPPVPGPGHSYLRVSGFHRRSRGGGERRGPVCGGRVSEKGGRLSFLFFFLVGGALDANLPLLSLSCSFFLSLFPSFLAFSALLLPCKVRLRGLPEMQASRGSASGCLRRERTRRASRFFQFHRRRHR